MAFQVPILVTITKLIIFFSPGFKVIRMQNLLQTTFSTCIKNNKGLMTLFLLLIPTLYSEPGVYQKPNLSKPPAVRTYGFNQSIFAALSNGEFNGYLIKRN